MNNNKNNIKGLLAFGILKLKKLQNPSLEAEVLLMNVINKDRIFFRTNSDYLLTIDEEILYKKFIQQRAKNIPIAYIIGYKNWAGLRIKVDKNVLIPRDETEILVQKIIQNSIKGKISINFGDPSRCQFEQKVQDYTILDIGTGSGCISLFLAKNLSNISINALDISEKALKIAKQNFKTHNLKANFIKSDLLEKIPNNTSFDLIVANLPYVPSNLEITKDLSYEPSETIFSGFDGLDHIKRLKSEIQLKNIKFKALWLEFLPLQKKAIKKIFNNYKTKFFTDSGGEIFFVKIY